MQGILRIQLSLGTKSEGEAMLSRFEFQSHFQSAR
jgi:hypothetical protein